MKEEYGGNCTGQPTEIEACNTQECPGKYKVSSSVSFYTTFDYNHTKQSNL